jgi:hypothetical protein
MYAPIVRREACSLGRFGGLEFVPPVISVRGYGGAWTNSNLSVNQARYNDFVPMVYGTAWYEPLVVFARNDGNLTRMEVLLGIGLMQGVVTVLVNGVQIPIGVSGVNMTGTGWYNIVTLGTRDGAFDMNFTERERTAGGRSLWQHGVSLCGRAQPVERRKFTPEIQVLAQGLIVPTYAADGTSLGSQFSNNPAWILLDVLQRSGWTAAELDFTSFAAAAAYCDQQINSTDLNGNAITLPRFQCNLVLQKRHSAGDCSPGNPQCRPAVPHIRARRRTPTASGKHHSAPAACPTGMVEQHGASKWRMAELRIWGWKQRVFGHHAAAERRAQRDSDKPPHSGHAEFL